MLNDHHPHSSASITIGRPAAELYQNWQNLAVRAQIADHLLDKIVPTDIAAGQSMKWVTPEGSGPHYRGEIQFSKAPGDWGTEVRLSLEVADEPGLLQKLRPHGAEAASKALAAKTLRRFKSLMETGEIPNLHANPSTRNNTDEK